MRMLDLLTKVLIVTVFISSFSLAQDIPNPGFENWTGNNPDGWFPNNPPTGPPPISPNSNAHSGSLCAQLEVVDLGGFPFPPVLSSGEDGLGFPVSQRYEAVNGYYKFAPQTGDFFDVAVQMWEGGIQGTLIGNGFFSTNAATTDWIQFSTPINYTGPGTPDWCTVLFLVGINQSLGGVALVDDLRFGGATGVDLLENGLVHKQFELSQNYPNPFNPSTNIEYSIPSESFVELKVYDVLGNEVVSLVNEQKQAGVYRAEFTADNLPSGMYFARIIANEFTKVVKMILLR